MKSCECCSRRRFLARCAACVGSITAGGLVPPLRAAETGARKPRIRLVFCETSNDKPIWPNIGYDFETRRKQLTEVLTRGCPEIELMPSILMDKPEEADGLLQDDAAVEGYLVCVQGLGWRNDIVKLCATGKPTLLADNLYGGSGLFLTRLPTIVRAEKPVDWVCSSRDEDIVASARQFALLKRGKSAAEVAAAFRAARHGRTPEIKDWQCLPDEVPTPDFDGALRRLRELKLVVVGGGRGGPAFISAAKETVGMDLVQVPFEDLAAAYREADRAAAAKFAAAWAEGAESAVGIARAELERCGAMYGAMKALMSKHGACGISINCLGGFYGGHMEAYPCLGFSQLNNDGLVGGCEADQMSALTMAVFGTLVGRPGYISDPVIDTSKNEIIYAHCVGMTKAFGPNGKTNPYHIRTHSEDRKGAAIQSLLPAGYMTTTVELNPVTKQVLMHQAKTTGNSDSDMACRTKLRAAVKGDIEKLTEEWRMGWHRVTFYGDIKDVVTELTQRLKFELIQEA